MSESHWRGWTSGVFLPGWMGKQNIRRQCYCALFSVAQSFSYLYLYRYIFSLKILSATLLKESESMSIPALQGCTWQPTGTASCLLVGIGTSLITAAVIACGSANTQRHQVLTTRKCQGHNVTPSLSPLEPVSYLCLCEAHKQGTGGHPKLFRLQILQSKFYVVI